MASSRTGSWLRRLDGRLSSAWLRRLQRVARPAAQALRGQLIESNALCFDHNMKRLDGTLVGFVEQKKAEHPEKVLLVRVGEFYETWGVDAVMLVEFAGLNAMGAKAKAGTPWRNVQSTLDSLTSAGLTVAVYEELADGDTDAAARRIKTRALAQIVSPAVPNYLYNKTLSSEPLDWDDGRNWLGVMEGVNGFALVEVNAQLREVVLRDRLTVEAVRTRIADGGLAAPLVLRGVDEKSPLCTAAGVHDVVRDDGAHGGSASVAGGPSPAELFALDMVRRTCTELAMSAPQSARLPEGAAASDASGWRMVRATTRDRPLPLGLCTAREIGLLGDPRVPSLVEALLPPRGHRAATSSPLLRRWLLAPPPRRIATQIHDLCLALGTSQIALPPLAPMPVGKATAFIYARQANSPLFRDIRATLNGVVELLRFHGAERDAIVTPLLGVVAEEAGVAVEEELLLASASAIVERIDVFIPPLNPKRIDDRFHHPNPPPPQPHDNESGPPPPHGVALLEKHGAFFIKNESFRGALRSECDARLQRAYTRVSQCTLELCAAIEDDFPGGASDAMYDVLNNRIMMKASAASSARAREKTVDDDGTQSSSRFVAPLDRRRRPIARRSSTAKVELAVDAYVDECASASVLVSTILQTLAEELEPALPVICHCAHASIVAVALREHVTAALGRGWALPARLAVTEDGRVSDSGGGGGGGDDGEETSTAACSRSSSSCSSAGSSSSAFVELTPHWLERDGATVRNSFTLGGLSVLTGPNMAGKSTLMRATVATALLANCGLHAPSSVGTVVPPIDFFYLRSASADTPTEGRSTFALEMEDCAVMLRDSSARSLICLDEFGRGTSSREGAALAASLIEHLDSIGAQVLFATHLHEIFALPLSLSHNVHFQQMGMKIDADNVTRGSFKVCARVCVCDV